MSDYVPLSRRVSGEEQVLHAGIPVHLEPPITEWIKEYETHEILRDATLTAEVWYAPADTERSAYRIPALLRGIKAATDPQKAFLDVVDSILFARVHAPDEETYERFREREIRVATECAESLEKILRLGGSHWRVEGDHLEARVDDSVREAVERARHETSGTSASTHLRDAWIACYGRNPNPGRAYSEAIKAVEAAAAPVVSPNNLRATLGTMLGALRPSATVWSFAIAPGNIDPVLIAMSTLWDGQTDRHGGVRPTVPIAPDAADAAVLLAATLVHWFATGAVKRR
jgi:hypothetical protein